MDLRKAAALAAFLTTGGIEAGTAEAKNIGTLKTDEIASSSESPTRIFDKLSKLLTQAQALIEKADNDKINIVEKKDLYLEARLMLGDVILKGREYYYSTDPKIQRMYGNLLQPASRLYHQTDGVIDDLIKKIKADKPPQDLPKSPASTRRKKTMA